MKRLYSLFVIIALFFNALYAQTNCENVFVQLGPDAFVCTGASFPLNPNPAAQGQYAWSGPGLSCTDCPSPTLTPPGIGIFAYIVQLQSGNCTAADTLIVTVAPGQPVQYNIANDKAICGGSVTLGGQNISGNLYTWVSNPPGFFSTAANPIVFPAQTTTYFLQVSNPSCPFPSIDSVQVRLFSQPVVDIQNDTSVCIGESLFIGGAAQSETTYSWTPNNGSLDNPNSANPLATPTQTTLYTVNAANPGCSTQATVQIAVVDFNASWSVGDTALLCKGDQLALTVQLNPAAVSTNWSPLTGLQLTPDGAILRPQSSTQYQLTASIPGCVRQLRVYVAVDSLPSNLAIFPSDTTVCLGSVVSLRGPAYSQTAFPDLQFQWLPSAGIITPDSLYQVDVQPATTTIYQRITQNGACADTTSAKVQLIQPQLFKVSPDTAVCPGQSVPLNIQFSSGVTDIVWSGPGLSCTNCNSPIATPTGSTTYIVRAKFQGCEISSSVKVTLLPTPPLQFPSDLMLCAGESITLNLANGPGNYTWTSTHPGFGTITDAQPTFTPTQSAVYYVTASSTCTVTANITVQVASATLEASRDTSICRGLSTTISAVSSVPGTFVWSDGQSGQAINVSPLQTNTYIVSFTYAGDCVLRDSVIVSISGQVGDVSFPTDQQLCAGESIQLNALNTPGATYAWSSQPAGFTSNLPDPVVMPTQTTMYRVTVTLGNCVKVYDETIVVYNASLTATADQNLCEGETLTLQANGSTTGMYLWSTGESTSSIKIFGTSVGSKQYDVSFTFGDGCLLQESVVINTIPGFKVRIVKDPNVDTLSSGQMVDLSAIISPTQSTANFKFAWKENGADLAGNGPNIKVTPVSSDSFTVFNYTVTVTAPNGCVQDTFVLFYLFQPQVEFPNAFTPNGDNINDTFKMILLKGEAIITRMDIYNRWGRKIYSSTEPQAAWNGEVEGQPAPADVYTFLVLWERSDGAIIPAQGSLTLIR